MDKEEDQKLRAAFAAQLRAERAAANISQKEVSARSGVSEASVIRYEQGTRDIKVSALYDLASAIGFDPVEFMNAVQRRFQD